MLGTSERALQLNSTFVRRNMQIHDGPYVLELINDPTFTPGSADNARSLLGVYFAPEGDGIVVHGELEISMLTADGERVWSRSGADVFSGELIVTETHAEVEDWEKRRYRFRLTDGKEST